MGGLFWWLHARQFETTDDAFIDAHIVPVGPKVAGLVARVLVDDNQPVNAGDLLAQIDPRDFDIALSNARAGLLAAEGKLAQAEAQVIVDQASAGSARADVIVAEAKAATALSDLKRYQALDPRATSKQQLDNAVSAERTTAASVDAARKKVDAAEAQVTFAQSQVQTAKADIETAKVALSNAQLQISYTQIRAPEAGRVTRRGIEAGQYVQVGQALLSIVPNEVYVTANYKETQLDRMRPGQNVTISIDSFTERKYRGHVDTIQKGSGARFSLMPPENATGNYVKVVQRVPVKIVFDETPEDLKSLAPGMSVEPKVRVRD